MPGAFGMSESIKVEVFRVGEAIGLQGDFDGFTIRVKIGVKGEPLVNIAKGSASLTIQKQRRKIRFVSYVPADDSPEAWAAYDALPSGVFSAAVTLAESVRSRHSVDLSGVEAIKFHAYM